MQNLSKHYNIAALSNVDGADCTPTLSGPVTAIKFDDVYVAEEIASYQPDHRNFGYLLKKFMEKYGAEKDQVLMVAHGSNSDHVPTTEMGIKIRSSLNAVLRSV